MMLRIAILAVLSALALPGHAVDVGTERQPPATRRLETPIRLQNSGPGRDDLSCGFEDKVGMRHSAIDRACRSGRRGRIQRPVLQRQPSQNTGNELSGGREFLQSANGRRQPLSLRVVVSEAVCYSRGGQRPHALAAFGGINYRANVWVNGKRIVDSTQVAGAYRTYEFDITRQRLPGKANVVAVETFAPTETDLGINWVDWNPCPPDKDMGLWGAVDLITSGPVSVRSPLVVTHLADDAVRNRRPNRLCRTS